MLRFGPNSVQVSAFRSELSTYAWFENLGRARPDDASLCRVDFPWMISNGGFTYQAWGTLLAKHKVPLDRLSFDHARLQEWDAVIAEFRLEAVLPNGCFDALLESLNDAFGPDGSYYPNTHTYPHEYVDLPSALTNYAALEWLMADLNPELHFFRGLMPYLRDGFWPAGWQGEWPDGRLILW